MSTSARTSGPQPGAYRALFLATLAFALCFAVWGLVSPLATQFQELYELSSTQISVVIATPVILGSLFRIPIGLFADRFGGRVVFVALMLVLVVPVLFIGLLGGSFGGLIFWGFFLGLAGSSFAVGVPFVNKWFPPHMQGLVLGVYGMGNIGSAIAAYAAGEKGPRSRREGGNTQRAVLQEQEELRVVPPQETAGGLGA